MSSCKLPQRTLWIKRLMPAVFKLSALVLNKFSLNFTKMLENNIIAGL